MKMIGSSHNIWARHETCSLFRESVNAAGCHTMQVRKPVVSRETTGSPQLGAVRVKFNTEATAFNKLV